jgi:hypothetical protein
MKTTEEKPKVDEKMLIEAIKRHKDYIAEECLADEIWLNGVKIYDKKELEKA